jgi:hypothetical protein
MNSLSLKGFLTSSKGGPYQCFFLYPSQAKRRHIKFEIYLACRKKNEKWKCTLHTKEWINKHIKRKVPQPSSVNHIQNYGQTMLYPVIHKPHFIFVVAYNMQVNFYTCKWHLTNTNFNCVEFSMWLWSQIWVFIYFLFCKDVMMCARELHYYRGKK